MDYLLDPNAPVFDGDAFDTFLPTPSDLALAALAPTIWLDMLPELMVKAPDGTFRYLVCRSSGRKFVAVPGGAPTIVPLGDAAPLDFTPGAAATRAIVAESGAETLLGGKVYSIAALVQSNGRGSILAGSAAQGAYPLLFADAENKATYWSHLNDSGSWPANQSLAGGWKLVLVSSAADSFRIEVDGQGVTYPNGPQALPAAGAALKAVIGGASGGGLDFPFPGRIAHVSFYPGVSLHNDPAARGALTAHIAWLKARAGIA